MITLIEIRKIEKDDSVSMMNRGWNKVIDEQPVVSRRKHGLLRRQIAGSTSTEDEAERQFTCTDTVRQGLAPAKAGSPALG